VSFPDLLPFPRTNEALEIISRNIDIVQSALGRQILVENPSLYLQLDGHEWPESLFLGELVKRTGCGLLIDVNNVFVSASNLGFNPISYLDALPRGVIGEIHLAGHSSDPFLGDALLIDSHDGPVADEVWKLYDRLLRLCGGSRPPTLIERDDNIPEFAELLAERDRAAAMMAGTREVVHA
jgi:uncharacterized protein (UPF0276 family)